MLDEERLFQHSIDLLCIAGKDGRFRKVNPAFSRVLGWSEEELIERPFLDFVHPDDRAATVKATEKQQGGQKVLRFENR